MENETSSEVRKLIPLTQWPDHHLDPPVQTLRKYIFENKHGFNDRVVVRRGRRVLIDEARYFEWLKEFTK